LSHWLSSAKESEGVLYLDAANHANSCVQTGSLAINFA
jgi:hypothetical protein